MYQKPVFEKLFSSFHGLLAVKSTIGSIKNVKTY